MRTDRLLPAGEFLGTGTVLLPALARGGFEAEALLLVRLRAFSFLDGLPCALQAVSE